MPCVPSRPPPASTRSPYTTLFRSTAGRVRSVHHAESDGRRVADENGVVPRQLRDRLRQLLQPAVVGEAAVDRKSTRLNSSHMSISYAVFCLKKKIPFGVDPSGRQNRRTYLHAVCSLTSATGFYTLSLHDALPIYRRSSPVGSPRRV